MAIHLCKLRVKVACIDINRETCSTTVQLALTQSVGIARVYICNITDKNEVSIIFIKYAFSLYNECSIDLIINKI